MLSKALIVLAYISVFSLGEGGSEDVALYVGLIAVAVCLVLLLLVVTLVYCRKKEGLDSDVADSSILTAGFQPVSIKPTKAGGYYSGLRPIAAIFSVAVLVFLWYGKQLCRQSFWSHIWPGGGGGQLSESLKLPALSLQMVLVSFRISLC